MPYVITTKTPDPANGKATAHVGDPIPGAPTPMGAVRGCWPDRVTRRAVATLEEAADRAVCVASQWDEHRDFPHWCSQATRLPESGGTVGPLPGGTVIEVAAVRPSFLFAWAHQHGIAPAKGLTLRDAIDAYNARS